VTARTPAHFRAALGRTIRHLRTTRDISQERLAVMAVIDRSYAGGIERGERRPTAEKVDQLISAMGVTWIEFATELTHQLASQPAKPPAGKTGKGASRTAKSGPR
jgi:transcriptional regulator with XRE-family HTH domain